LVDTWDFISDEAPSDVTFVRNLLAWIDAKPEETRTYATMAILWQIVDGTDFAKDGGAIQVQATEMMKDRLPSVPDFTLGEIHGKMHLSSIYCLAWLFGGDRFLTREGLENLLFAEEQKLVPNLEYAQGVADWLIESRAVAPENVAILEEFFSDSLISLLHTNAEGSSVADFGNVAKGAKVPAGKISVPGAVRVLEIIGTLKNPDALGTLYAARAQKISPIRLVGVKLVAQLEGSDVFGSISRAQAENGPSRNGPILGIDNRDGKGTKKTELNPQRDIFKEGGPRSDFKPPRIPSIEY
jgi:hypothetical protein